MDIKLIIPKKIHSKYTYLLNRFKDLEWSGPAWYKVKKDEDGFPVEWRIVHFHALNLGSHAATEWEAKDLANILKETYATIPSLKKAYMGLIHSHNTMGAFLSGTDTKTIIEMAPDEGFYGSLVVASGGKALHAFGFSYNDQYKYSHYLEVDEDEIEIVNPQVAAEEWIQEADLIEKNKPVTKYPIVRYGQQGTIWNNPQVKKASINVDERAKFLNKLPKSQQKTVMKIIKNWDDGKLTDIAAEVALEDEGKLKVDQIELCLGLDPALGSNYGGYYQGYGGNYDVY